MATYAELFDLRANSSIRNRVAVACTLAADAIRQEAGSTANHANRLIWAKQVWGDPDAMAVRIYPAILAQNASLTTAQIQAATDANILTAVQNVIDIFATGS